MPLTKSPSRNIAELIRKCKRTGKFGTGKKTSLKKCIVRAKAAGLSAARRLGGRVSKRAARR